MSSTGFMITLSAASCRKHYGAIIDELQRRLFTEDRTSITADDFSSVVETLMGEVGKKVAKEPKAKKVKAPKGPGVREQARQAALKQLSELDAEKAVELADAKTADIKKAIKAINKANKPVKAKKPSAKTLYPTDAYTQQRVRHAGNDLKGVNGKFLRVAKNKVTHEVHIINEDNWSEESKAMLSQIYTVKEGKFYNLPKAKKAKATKVAKKPAAKKVKKAKKAPAPAAEEKTEENTEEKPKVKKSQKDLIASLVADAAEQVVAAPATAEAKKPTPTVDEVTKGVEEMKVADEQVQGELEEEDVDDSDEELQEMSDSDDDSDDEDIEYDADDVEPFEHSSRPGEKLFIDGEQRVWDEDQSLVGTYNAAVDTIF